MDIGSVHGQITLRSHLIVSGRPVTVIEVGGCRQEPRTSQKCSIGCKRFGRYGQVVGDATHFLLARSLVMTTKMAGFPNQADISRVDVLKAHPL